jgi:intracellular sulfur oxidation DsrE/DsrF family protein
MAAPAQEASPRRFVADIELQTAGELHQTLIRAEQLLVEGVAVQGGDVAVTFILHGPVIRDLLRDNYLDNKPMVDLAASLSALGVISVKACRTWMSSHRVDAGQLQPFVETVSFGPGEVQRLVQEENYLHF